MAAAIVVADPYRGMTYSQVLESLPADQRRKYTERPHKLTRRMPLGETMWDASIGRHVTI